MLRCIYYSNLMNKNCKLCILKIEGDRKFCHGYVLGKCIITDYFKND